MNKVELIGNLTRDPELGTTGNGVSYCRMSIAVNRTFENADGNRDTDYFNITCWRGLAESCGKHLSKGKKIAVVGSLQTRSYEDKDGITRYATDIIAQEVDFLSPIGNGNKDAGVPGAEKYDKPSSAKDEPASKGKGKNKEAPQLEEITDDDLPFN